MMDRTTFIKTLGLSVAGIATTSLSAFGRKLKELPDTPKMPVVFLGHGIPTNAIVDSPFTQSLRKLGENIPRPNAIMVVSAHWETRGTFVSAIEKPPMIYDFSGFPEEMYKVKYEAPGSAEYASTVAQSLHEYDVKLNQTRGFDHGNWTVLKHMYPKADVPIFQLSLDATKPASWHFDLAKQLIPLRHKGLLIIGSGNIVHNLRNLSWQDKDAEPFDWAQEFDSIIKEKLLHYQFQDLVNYEKLGTASKMAIPTNEHYLPMLYTIGLHEMNEHVHFSYEAIEYGSLAMRCFTIS